MQAIGQRSRSLKLDGFEEVLEAALLAVVKAMWKNTAAMKKRNAKTAMAQVIVAIAVEVAKSNQIYQIYS